MKKARLILSASLLTIAAFTSVTMISCSKDDSGCTAGYEGKNCDTEVRAKFLGTWVAVDQQVNGPELPAYNVVISKNTSSVSKMNIGGISNSFYVENVIVTASGTSFDIPAQDPDGDGYNIAGSGTINADGNEIQVSYTLTENATNTVLSYTGTWTK